VARQQNTISREEGAISKDRCSATRGPGGNSRGRRDKGTAVVKQLKASSGNMEKLGSTVRFRDVSKERFCRGSSVAWD
jgi:hypothetical protein